MASSSKNVKLSDSETKFLIELYRSHNVLWNSQSSNYKNHQYRDKALQSIQLAFETNYGRKIEVNILKTKLQSFRNSFCKELSFIQESQRSNARTDEVYVPRYPYFHDLIFLRHVVKIRHSTTNLDDSFLLNQSSIKNEILDEPAQSQLHWLSTETTQINDDEVSRSPAAVSTSASETPQEDPAESDAAFLGVTAVKKQRKRKLDQETEVSTSFNSALQRILTQSATPEANPMTTWAQNLVNDILQIKDLKRQKRLKIKISRLVQDALEEDLENDN